MKRRRALALVLAIAAQTAAGPARADSWRERLFGPREAVRLRSDSPPERIAAARALGRYGEPRSAVGALAAALEAEREGEVRRAIVEALARRGDPAAVPSLARLIRTGRTAEREAAVAAVGAIGSDEAIRLLASILEQEELADDAKRQLAELGPRATPQVLRALRVPAARTMAIDTLGEIGDRRATGALVALLADDATEARLAATRALGTLGDERASRAVAERLTDPSPDVVLAALVALGRIGGPEQRDAVARSAAHGSDAERAVALRALVRIDPEMGARSLAEITAAGGDSKLRRVAVEITLDIVHPAIAPVLARILRHGPERAQAASALAEVDAGAGVPALRDAVARGGEAAAASIQPLAIALRTWRDALDASFVEGALAILRASPFARSPDRALVLRAVARDPDVAPRLLGALRSRDARLRAAGALGLEALGDPDHAAALVERLEREQDGEAFRREAMAAVRLGAKARIARLWPLMAAMDTAPEAMAIAASSADGSSEHERKRLAVALRRGLRDRDPRTRAGAAMALALAHDTRAWRALVAALDDADPAVRLAVAHALAALAPVEATASVRAAWRVETDPAIRAALDDAASGHRRTRALAYPSRGAQTLRVRVARNAEAASTNIVVDVLLPDGRWLRTHTLTSGEVIVVDLPSGVADVRVRLAD